MTRQMCPTLIQTSHQKTRPSLHLMIVSEGNSNSAVECGIRGGGGGGGGGKEREGELGQMGIGTVHVY